MHLNAPPGTECSKVNAHECIQIHRIRNYTTFGGKLLLSHRATVDHRLKGRLRFPWSTQVLSTRSLRRYSISLLRSVSPSTQLMISGARCPILPGGIVIGNQVGDGPPLRAGRWAAGAAWARAWRFAPQQCGYKDEGKNIPTCTETHDSYGGNR